MLCLLAFVEKLYVSDIQSLLLTQEESCWDVQHEGFLSLKFVSKKTKNWVPCKNILIFVLLI